jgi:hypothetical protein
MEPLEGEVKLKDGPCVSKAMLHETIGDARGNEYPANQQEIGRTVNFSFGSLNEETQSYRVVCDETGKKYWLFNNSMRNVDGRYKYDEMKMLSRGISPDEIKRRKSMEPDRWV